jgi:hypothetical protein
MDQVQPVSHCESEDRRALQLLAITYGYDHLLNYFFGESNILMVSFTRLVPGASYIKSSKKNMNIPVTVAPDGLRHLLILCLGLYSFFAAEALRIAACNRSFNLEVGVVDARGAGGADGPLEDGRL